MAKLSGLAVLFLVIHPLSMYTFSLVLGIQLGRLLERGADNSGGVDYVTKVMDRSIISSTIAMAAAIATACSCMHHLHLSVTYTLLVFNLF
jgi:hypothetical protein